MQGLKIRPHLSCFLCEKDIPLEQFDRVGRLCGHCEKKIEEKPDKTLDLNVMGGWKLKKRT